MLKVILIACFLALVRSQSPSFGSCPTVKTQDTVDLEKYLGFWYEIMSFPTPFEKGKCVRAKYSMKSNGHLEVQNRDIENGKEVDAVGDGYRPDDKEQGKLLVKFAAQAPYSKYWIVHTDYEQFSLVSSCVSVAGVAHLEFGWILSRNSTLDTSTVQRLKNELASYKVDVSKFKVTDQSGCPS